MLKHKIMRDLEAYSKNIDNSQETLYQLRAEKKIVNKEYLKLLDKFRISIEPEKSQIGKLKDYAMQRLFELDEKIKAEVSALEKIADDVSKKFHILFDVLDTFYGSFELFKMLKQKTGEHWKVQYINTPEGGVVGACLVNERDPKWNKQIRANISFSENKVDIESTDTMKVLFTELNGNIDYVIENWDWLQFSVFFTTEFYMDDEMGERYFAFIEKNKDFAEFIATEIRNDFYKEDLSEILNQNQQEQ